MNRSFGEVGGIEWLRSLAWTALNVYGAGYRKAVGRVFFIFYFILNKLVHLRRQGEHAMVSS
jgi:hypothetical protein